MKPSRAALAGLVFPAFGVVYFVFATVVDPAHVEYAAIVLLLALGVATSLMAYVLFAGLSQS
jgi:hypothetical protein